METILLISLKLNFTPNTLGCYGLKRSNCAILERGTKYLDGLDCNKSGATYYLIEASLFDYR